MANSHDFCCYHILWPTFSLRFGDIWAVGGGSTVLLLVFKLSRKWNVVFLYKSLRGFLDFTVARRKIWKVVRRRKCGEMVWWGKILFIIAGRNSQFCSWLYDSFPQSRFGKMIVGIWKSHFYIWQERNSEWSVCTIWNFDIFGNFSAAGNLDCNKNTIGSQLRKIRHFPSHFLSREVQNEVPVWQVMMSPPSGFHTADFSLCPNMKETGRYYLGPLS